MARTKSSAETHIHTPFHNHIRERTTDSDLSMGDLPGWVLYGYWLSNDVPVEFVTGSWVVPEEPKKKDGQTIFLHQAIQAGYGKDLLILSVATQWGPSAAGGGDSWGLTCFAAKGTDVYTGALVELDPGDEVQACFEYSVRSGLPAWECRGESKKGETQISIVSLAGMSSIDEVYGAVLEAYSETAMTAAHYPDSDSTLFHEIEVDTSDATCVDTEWSTKVVSPGYGRRIVANGVRELELFYRS
jgi:hypothetical protein